MGTLGIAFIASQFYYEYFYYGTAVIVSETKSRNVDIAGDLIGIDDLRMGNDGIPRTRWDPSNGRSDNSKILGSVKC